MVRETTSAVVMERTSGCKKYLVALACGTSVCRVHEAQVTTPYNLRGLQGSALKPNIYTRGVFLEYYFVQKSHPFCALFFMLTFILTHSDLRVRGEHCFIFLFVHRITAETNHGFVPGTRFRSTYVAQTEKTASGITHSRTARALNLLIAGTPGVADDHLGL